MKKLLTTKQLARRRQKPISAIQRWTRMKIIPVIDCGFRTKLYDEEAVERALLKRTVREKLS